MIPKHETRKNIRSSTVRVNSSRIRRFIFDSLTIYNLKFLFEESCADEKIRNSRFKLIRRTMLKVIRSEPQRNCASLCIDDDTVDIGNSGHPNKSVFKAELYRSIVMLHICKRRFVTPKVGRKIYSQTMVSEETTPPRVVHVYGGA